MNFAERFKELYGIPAYVSLEGIGGMTCYVKIGDSAVALFERWSSDFIGTWMSVSIYHGNISEDSDWIYKDLIYFLEELKRINPDFAKHISSDMFSHSWVCERFEDGGVIWVNELGEYKI